METWIDDWHPEPHRLVTRSTAIISLSRTIGTNIVPILAAAAPVIFLKREEAERWEWEWESPRPLLLLPWSSSSATGAGTMCACLLISWPEGSQDLRDGDNCTADSPHSTTLGPIQE